MNNAKKDTTRHTRLTCLVSDDEMRIIDNYLAKYKISNKSRWMRQTLFFSFSSLTTWSCCSRGRQNSSL